MRSFVSVLILCSCVGFAATPANAADESAASIVQNKCIECHSGDQPAGDFDLSLIDPIQSSTNEIVTSNRHQWSLALARVKFHEMPPRDTDSLTEEEKNRVVSWIEQALRLPNPHADVGPSKTRRLTRFEYNATLRDLLGIHIDLAQGLPTDAAGGEGFDNASETMLLSELHIEKYIQAANEAVEYVAKDSSARNLVFGEQETLLQQEQSIALEHAKVVMQRFLTRAFRRPCTDQELSRYMAVVQQQVDEGFSADNAILRAIRSALVSPNFLFRVEASTASNAPERITDFELATRLSYFLWSSLPDHELMTLAEKNQLSDPKVLREQVDRMLKEGFGSDRSDILKVNALAENFMGQWLGTRDLGVRLKPDRTANPGYEYQIEFAMKREPIDFFEHMLVENRSLLDLIDSDYSFMARESVNYYGLDGKVEIRGWGQVHRVTLPPDSHRGGVLGMGAVLAVSSYEHRTSPVLRGKWILETFLDSSLPPPPPNIPNLDAQKDAHQDLSKLSLRERLEQHRADPTCATCHDRIDPIGFALENYSVTGIWRDQDGEHPIDAKATLENGQVIEGPAGLKQMLLERKHEFARVVTRKMLGYALGRGLTNSDLTYVEQILDRLSANDYRVRELIYGIVECEPFLYKQTNPSSSLEK